MIIIGRVFQGQSVTLYGLQGQILHPNQIVREFFQTGVVMHLWLLGDASDLTCRFSTMFYNGTQSTTRPVYIFASTATTNGAMERNRPDGPCQCVQTWSNDKRFLPTRFDWKAGLQKALRRRIRVVKRIAYLTDRPYIVKATAE